MQMPHQYWYWALRQSVQVLNCIPCTVEGLSTTPHELVYGVKPDLCVLFRMFLRVSFAIFIMGVIIIMALLNPVQKYAGYCSWTLLEVRWYDLLLSSYQATVYIFLLKVG
jgi:hypothetical protein